MFLIAVETMTQSNSPAAVDPDLLEEAQSLEIDLSKVNDDELRAEVAAARQRRWKTENQSAINSYNDWIEANGLPLERWRRF